MQIVHYSADRLSFLLIFESIYPPPLPAFFFVYGNVEASFVESGWCVATFFSLFYSHYGSILSHPRKVVAAFLSIFCLVFYDSRVERISKTYTFSFFLRISKRERSGQLGHLWTDELSFGKGEAPCLVSSVNNNVSVCQTSFLAERDSSNRNEDV